MSRNLLAARRLGASIVRERCESSISLARVGYWNYGELSNLLFSASSRQKAHARLTSGPLAATPYNLGAYMHEDLLPPRQHLCATLLRLRAFHALWPTAFVRNRGPLLLCVSTTAVGSTRRRRRLCSSGASCTAARTCGVRAGNARQYVAGWSGAGPPRCARRGVSECIIVYVVLGRTIKAHVYGMTVEAGGTH